MDRQTSHSPKALMEESDKPYVPHDVLDETAKTALVGLGSGFFLAAIQNALSKRNVGAMSVFTRGAPVIGICGMERPETCVRARRQLAPAGAAFR